MSSNSPQDFGRVAVLMGGWAAERPVSLRSGAMVLQSLLEAGVDAFGIDVGRDILQRLESEHIDRVFIALHGRGGEDGVIQGALEILGLPYTGSGVAASAVGMDKLLTKRIWRDCGLPTPEFMVLEPDFDAADVFATLGLPLIVKPSLEGSSIGVTKVRDASELAAAYQTAQACGGPVMGERCIQGQEYTVALLAGEALPVIRVETPHVIFDYEAKYHSSETVYHCPSGLAPETERMVQELALKAFSAIGCTGWGRVDLFLDQAGKPWLIEVNTAPGMTASSLVPRAAQTAGMSLPELVMRILATTLNSRESK